MPDPMSVFVHLKIGPMRIVAVWNTGAQMSIIPLSLVQELVFEHKIEHTPVVARGVGGNDLKLEGRVRLSLEFSDYKIDPDIFKGHKERFIEIPHYFEVQVVGE